MISEIEEIKLKNGQTLSIQFDREKIKWEVALWNKDDSCHWYKEFHDRDSAYKEYDKWKNY